MTIATTAKKYGFTGSGAALGAMTGGPIGLVFGAGLGAAMDWWRMKNAPPPAPVAATIVPPVPTLHLLPLQMQQQPFAPATLDAIAHLKPIRMAQPTAKPTPKISFAPAQGQRLHIPPPPPKKPAPPPPRKPPPPPPPPPQQSSDDSGSASASFDVSGSFSI